MDRPKILPSSMRDRKRYIAFEVISDKKIEFPEMVNSFWNALLSLLGELGTSKSNVWFVKDTWKDENQIGLIRCNHDYTEHVRSALAMITSIDEKRVIIHSLGISGTMKAARRKFLGERTLEDFEDE